MFDPNHPYKFVVYFYGDKEYLTDDGEVKRKGNAFWGTPYPNQPLPTAFKFIRKILKSECKVLGYQYAIEDQIPQKLQIFHNNECILTVPAQQGETITDRSRNKQMLVNALNEFELFVARFTRKNGNIAIEKEIVQPKEEEEQRLKNERNSVFSKLNQYCYDQLGYKLSQNKALYDLIVMNLKYRIKDILNYYHELKELIDKEVQKEEVFETLTTQKQSKLERTAVEEPSQISQVLVFNKTPKVTTNQHLIKQDNLGFLKEAAVETLVFFYEKKSRKATQKVKETFTQRINSCKDKVEIDAVLEDFRSQMEKGKF